MKRYLPIIFLLLQYFANGQTSCGTAQPFCTGTKYTFPASTNTTSATLANFGCIRILILEC